MRIFKQTIYFALTVIMVISSMSHLERGMLVIGLLDGLAASFYSWRLLVTK